MDQPKTHVSLFDQDKIYKTLSKGRKKLAEILQLLGKPVTLSNISRLNKFLIVNNMFRLINKIPLMYGKGATDRIFENTDYKDSTEVEPTYNYAEYVHYILHKILFEQSNPINFCVSFDIISTEMKKIVPHYAIKKLKASLRANFDYCYEHCESKILYYTFKFSGKYTRNKQSKLVISD
jgi:hypothetical protein